MEKINPDTQTSPLCLFTCQVIIAARDPHPPSTCLLSHNQGLTPARCAGTVRV